jgi:hypothetical protein
MEAVQPMIKCESERDRSFDGGDYNIVIGFQKIFLIEVGFHILAAWPLYLR